MLKYHAFHVHFPQRIKTWAIIRFIRQAGCIYTSRNNSAECTVSLHKGETEIFLLGPSLGAVDRVFVYVSVLEKSTSLFVHELDVCVSNLGILKL